MLGSQSLSVPVSPIADDSARSQSDPARGRERLNRIGQVRCPRASGSAKGDQSLWLNSLEVQSSVHKYSMYLYNTRYNQMQFRSIQSSAMYTTELDFHSRVEKTHTHTHFTPFAPFPCRWELSHGKIIHVCQQENTWVRGCVRWSYLSGPFNPQATCVKLYRNASYHIISGHAIFKTKSIGKSSDSQIT